MYSTPLNVLTDFLGTAIILWILLISVVVSANPHFTRLDESVAHEMGLTRVFIPQQQTPSPSDDNDKTPPGTKKHKSIVMDFGKLVHTRQEV